MGWYGVCEIDGKTAETLNSGVQEIEDLTVIEFIKRVGEKR